MYESIIMNLTMVLQSETHLQPWRQEQATKYLGGGILANCVDCKRNKILVICYSFPDLASETFRLDHLVIILEMNISFFPQVLFFSYMTVSVISLSSTTFGMAYSLVGAAIRVLSVIYVFFRTMALHPKQRPIFFCITKN